MRGLYISFVIRRRKRMDKVMDFFLVFSLFIFVFTFLFYVQYVQKEGKYNSTSKKLNTANAEAATLKAQVDKMDKENASVMEKDYNSAYKELSTMTETSEKYRGYIKDIYDAKLAGVTINSIKANIKEGIITLSLTFDRSVESQVDYRYRAVLLDYKWIPKDGIVYTDTNLTTSWEVYVSDGTTTKE